MRTEDTLPFHTDTSISHYYPELWTVEKNPRKTTISSPSDNPRRRNRSDPSISVSHNKNPINHLLIMWGFSRIDGNLWIGDFLAWILSCPTLWQKKDIPWFYHNYLWKTYHVCQFPHVCQSVHGMIFYCPVDVYFIFIIDCKIDDLWDFPYGWQIDGK